MIAGRFGKDSSVEIEALTLADRIVILKDGKVQQVGTPVEVYEQPDNRFVAGFIGNPPINMLPAVVSRGYGGRAGRGRPGSGPPG